MDGLRLVVPFHIHGTMTANAIIRYKMPCNATLVQVDTCGTANVVPALIVGTPADDDGYIKTYTPGKNAVVDTRKRGNFDGALNPDPKECPRIAKDTVVQLTYTHASASDVDIVLTFLEG